MNPALPGPALQGHQKLGEALLRFGSYRKFWELLHGAARFVMAGPGLLLAWVMLDWVALLPAWPLFLSFVVFSAITIWACITWVIRPQLRGIDPKQEALMIEALHGKLDNQLIGSWQLGLEVTTASERKTVIGYSPLIVAELLQRTAALIDSLKTRELLDLTKARRALTIAGLILAVSVGMFVFAPQVMKQRWERLQDAYSLILDTLFPVEIKVTPGDLAVIRGHEVKLVVEIPGARRNEVKLILRQEGAKEPQTLTLKLENNRAEYAISNAQESFQYTFEYGNRPSSAYQIKVGDLPDIKTINYEMAYPAYTGQPSRTLTGRIPKLRGLTGTTVLVSFASTTDLHPDLSYVEWLDGSKQAIQFSGRFGHFAFTIAKPDRATLHLTSALAKPPHEKEWRMQQPLSFEVEVQRDEPPTIQIPLKNKKMTLFADQAALFAFDWVAEDDFGVSEVSVEYKIDCIDELLGRKARQDSQTRNIEPARELAKGRFADLFKNLTPPLEPGDRITITVSAKDNNTETGPGGARSLPIEIVVVQPDLGAFVEQKFGFGMLNPMGDMVKVKRSTDLLIDAEKTVRTEISQKIEKKDLKSSPRQESWPSGAEDATGEYFRLLSGEK